MKKFLLLLSGLLLAAGATAQPAQGEVRNIIYLIGDGMGLSHVSLMKIEKGYAPTAFDRAQNIALITTYSANNRVTDSAAAGTALACGAKTNNGTLGLDAGGNRIESMIARATRDGMATGLVVTYYLQHATPAAFYAHVKHRGETDAITADMLPSGIDVLFGGGRKWLARECAEGGSYLDAFVRRGYRVATALEETADMHRGRVLCAVAEEEAPRAPERGDYLPEASKKAMELLAANTEGKQKGFVLMIEGSFIDSAAHANDTDWLEAEMNDFEKCVAAAMDFADAHPGTLVVVTADHETGGLSVPSGDKDFTRSESGIDYRYGTSSHTGSMVPVYLYGAGAERINGLMDNTELSQRMMELLGLE
ncbi:alkaline phosphatase [Alistipes sp.]|uniref:alkaline phosphatase n=1 Tax=Alistipes sp. TaxID=1872444 RepID=UPI000E98DA5F|nr:alkaline phosphatase [Alistipes sp.]HBX90188.1 alkaline phosphatase [Alistipes sp.]HCN13435.1 alkaline phosphatase [Alistipes sp.]